LWGRYSRIATPTRKRVTPPRVWRGVADASEFDGESLTMIFRKMGKVYTNTHLREKRNQLRNNGTPAEAVLWNSLKNSQLEGRKFRRQHSIENYIVDFYCVSEKLAVELDGQGHFTVHGSRYDDDRDMLLKKYGIRTLRYENELIFKSIESVLEDIKSHFKQS
jgi:very-short-patch-repair endonuclease